MTKKFFKFIVAAGCRNSNLRFGGYVGMFPFRVDRFKKLDA